MYKKYKDEDVRPYNVHTKEKPKVNPPILLCCLATSKANVTGIKVEVETSTNLCLRVCVVTDSN